MDGIALIAAERKRQIEEEGCTPEHDDRHSEGTIAAAAACYANFARLQLTGDPVAPAATGPLAHRVAPPAAWPWDWDWWKPSEDPTRNLVKAGALTAAAIDRIQRQEAPMPTDDIELERNRYYVAEVELFPGNPRHRAIVRPYVVAGKRTEIELLSYEDKLRRLVKNLHFFRVICEIGEMR